MTARCTGSTSSAASTPAASTTRDIQWGFAASPIIYDGKVILQVDIHDGCRTSRPGTCKTGEPLWRTERPDVAPSWATPNDLAHARR